MDETKHNKNYLNNLQDNHPTYIFKYVCTSKKLNTGIVVKKIGFKIKKSSSETYVSLLIDGHFTLEDIPLTTPTPLLNDDLFNIVIERNNYKSPVNSFFEEFKVIYKEKLKARAKKNKFMELKRSIEKDYGIFKPFRTPKFR